MRKQHYIILNMAVLFAMFFTGCSKSPGKRSSHAHGFILTNLTNLGTMTISSQPKLFSLKAGKSLQISGSQTQKGIDMKLVVMMTNADGILVPIPDSQIEIETRQGQQVGSVFGDVSVKFKATMEPQ